MRPLTTEAHWDAHWEGFRLPYRVDLRSYYSHRCDQLFRRIIPRSGNQERRFIDIGCGLGQWLIYFHETFGYDVTGVDNSPAACEQARRNLHLASVPGEIICGDVMSAPLEPGSFDVVYSGGLIEHFDDPLPLVQKMSSLVKPGGLHLIFVPNLQGALKLIRERIAPGSFEGHREISPEMLQGMLEQSGMTDIRVSYFGSLRLPHVRRRGRGESGIQAPLPLWFALRAVDRGITGTMRRLDRRPEARWISPEIVAIARAKRQPQPAVAGTSRALVGAHAQGGWV
jgi:SAM-dependent methyltransferase